MKSIRIVMMALCLSFLSLSAWALDVDDAKAEGLVGETTTGYLAAVSDSPSGEVKALVEDINDKRKEMYANIAKKRNVPVSSVEKLAAKKAYEKTAAGHYIQGPSGDWVKK